jgi:hypothetical protein
LNGLGEEVIRPTYTERSSGLAVGVKAHSKRVIEWAWRGVARVHSEMVI